MSEGTMQYMLGIWNLDSPALQSHQPPALLRQVFCCLLTQPPTQTPPTACAQDCCCTPPSVCVGGQGVGGGRVKVRVPGHQVGCLGTWEDFHDIKQQIQNTMYRSKEKLWKEKAGGTFSLLFGWETPRFQFARGASLYNWNCVVEKITNLDCIASKPVLLSFLRCSCL